MLKDIVSKWKNKQKLILLFDGLLADVLSERPYSSSLEFCSSSPMVDNTTMVLHYPKKERKHSVQKLHISLSTYQ